MKSPYKQAELEEAIGASLSSLFEGNESQQKSVAFANKHGGLFSRPPHDLESVVPSLI